MLPVINSEEFNNLLNLREILINQSKYSFLFGSIAQRKSKKVNDIDICAVVPEENKDYVINLLRDNLSSSYFFVDDLKAYTSPPRNNYSHRMIHVSCACENDLKLNLPQIDTIKRKNIIPLENLNGSANFKS